MKYSIRPAQSSDYEFLFDLKKAAEFEPIKAVFGWDEQVQRDIHAEEWAEERPEIIEHQGKARLAVCYFKTKTITSIFADSFCYLSIMERALVAKF